MQTADQLWNEVQSNPLARHLAVKLANKIAREKGKDGAINEMITLQRSIDTPIISIIQEIAVIKGRTFVDSALSAYVQQLRKDPANSTIAAAWTQLLTDRRITEDVSRIISKLPYELISAYFSLFSEDTQIIDMKDLAKAAWTHDGKDISWISHPLYKMLGVAEPSNLDRNALLKHQDNILNEGWLKYDGADRTQYSFDSFMYFDRIFYTFLDNELWLAMSGLEAGFLGGAYIPRLNVFVRTTKHSQRMVTEASAIAAKANLLWRYCSARAEGRDPLFEGIDVSKGTNVILAVGGVENFAHQVLNTYSGIERIIESGSVRKVGEILFYGTEFFGPLESIFPETSAIRKKKFMNRGNRATRPFSRSDILCNIGGFHVSSNLRTRLVSHAIATSSIKQFGPNFVQQRQNERPLIYVGVRVGDKSWINQVTEIPRLMSQIASHSFDPVWVLDAFSRPSGDDYVSSSWSGFVEETESIIRTIIEHGDNNGISTINISGLTLNEAISSLQSIDVYLAPLGTAQHKIGWFTNAMGAIYAGSKWASTPVQNLPGLSCVEGAPMPHVLIGRSEGNENLIRSIHDTRANLDRVELSAEQVSSWLIPVLEQLRS